MKTDSLRKIISLQTVSVVCLPFVLLTALGLFWFLPRFVADTEDDQVQLSRIVTANAENYLIRSTTVLEGVANLISACDDPANYPKILRSQIRTAPSLKAIYLISPQKKVKAVALKIRDRSQEKDLINLDLSRNVFFNRAVAEKKAVWSDTFLSVVGGGLSVALAIPAGDDFVMGEIDLGRLTDFLKQITTLKDEMIMILDRRGQVIADQDGHFTAQQLNLSHLPILKKKGSSKALVVEDFELNQARMTGCLVSTSLAGWSVLVAIPWEQAHRPIWEMGRLLALALTGTVLAGVSLGIAFSRRLVLKFEILASHARRIARGEKDLERPVFNIQEFSSLAGDIQDMADAVREREAYNRVLFADSPIPLLVIEIETLRLIDANAASLRVFGVKSASGLTDKSVSDLSGPDQAEGLKPAASFSRHVSDCLKKGYTEFEWSFIRHESEIWPAEVVLSLFHHGRRQLLQMSIKDISLQKAEETRRKKLEEQLRQAQKMESIGTLAGGIAHDFNNILFPVMGYTEMVIQDLPEDSPHHHPLQEALKGCLRAKDLVDQILTFSRRGGKELKPLKISLIIKEILKLIRATLPSTIVIEKDISENCGLVLADPTQVHQVVMNLVTNAFHAMEETGGKLTISLRDEQILSGTFPHTDLIPGWYVCLTVSDTGVGIAPENLEMIYDPYFTTKGKSKGTGLGLSVVHGIVKNYSGDILVESRKGKGTVFRVYLPRFVGRQSDTEKPAIPVSFKGSGHILLVDDEISVSAIIEKILKRIGYRVTVCNASPEALSMFQTSPRTFDLVLTDMTMPDLTGDRLAEAIKKIRPDIPVILCTGYSGKISQVASSGQCVDRVLRKPVLRDELIMAIQSVLTKMQNQAGSGGK